MWGRGCAPSSFYAAPHLFYAGAILVGWTLAQGIAAVIGLVLQPVFNIATNYINRRPVGYLTMPTPERKIFDSVELGVGAVKAVVILGIGLLLLRWIYLPEPAAPAAEEIEQTE